MKDGEEEKCWVLSNSQTLRRSTDRKADYALRPFLTGEITLPAGMKSAGKNHPGRRIFIRRDEINREESSLRENFCRQG